MGSVTAYRVTVETFVLNPRAAREVEGLSLMFGGQLALAEAFAPQPDVLVTAPELKSEHVVCIECATPALALSQQANEREEAAKKEKSS